MTDSDIDENLEKKLHGVLNPVTPRPSYINELQNRLTTKPKVIVEYPNYLITVLVLSSGLAFGSLLIFLLNKIFKGASDARAS